MKPLNAFAQITLFVTIYIGSRLFVVPLIWRKQIIFTDEKSMLNQWQFTHAIYHTTVILAGIGISKWIYIVALIFATLSDLFIFAKKSNWFKNRR